MTAEFGPGFMWGAATAAFQIEGALYEDGRGPSIWDRFVERSDMCTLLDPSVTTDHYHRLEEDLDLIAELGLRAYRFSIAWPRVLPTGRGAVNGPGLDFYRRLVAGLRDRGVVPVATLYHFDLPQALEDRGGWASRATAEHFAEYAATVAEALADDVTYWITINEPWAAAWLGYGTAAFAPGRVSTDEAIAATHHQLLGHGLATAAIRAVQPHARVGATLGLTPIRTPGEDLDDKRVAELVDASLNRMCLDPLLRAHYPAELLHHYREHERGLGTIRPGDLERINAPIDFLGVNYYTPRLVVARDNAERLPVGLERLASYGSENIELDFGAVEVARRGTARTSIGWAIDPTGLTELLIGLARDYPPIPLMITENGAAFNDRQDDGRFDDLDRIRYLAAHIAAVHEAIAEGADVRGYFVWSLLDNFEWIHGLSQRFGLVHVDPDTQRRTPKESAYWYRELISSGGHVGAGVAQA